MIVSKSPFFNKSIKLVNSKSDLPAAVAGVINLEDEVSYCFLEVVDLLGDRIVCGTNNVIEGKSTENCRLKSTGLSGTALITSEYSLNIKYITIEADIALDLDATANADQALDWNHVNFTDCGTVGTIKAFSNFIGQTIGVINSGSLTFDGSTGTIGITDSLFDASSGSTSIVIPATATITRRFRMDKCAFIALSGETSLNVSTSASIPDEGYILERINFAGGGTYLSGVQYDDNKALFGSCRGINNSSTVGQYYMLNNATLTSISSTGVFVKIAGTTSEGSLNERFDVTTTSNKAVYEGALIDNFVIDAILVVEGGNNKEFSVRLAKNGTTISQSESRSTTSGNGRAENVVVQDIVNLETSDYIEVFIANETDTTDLTAVNLNLIIKRIS